MNTQSINASNDLADPKAGTLPFLFEASLPHETGGTRFYLLGSQHNLPKDLVAPGVEKLLSECDILVKEITGSVFGDASDIPLKDLKLHGLLYDNHVPDWIDYLEPKAREYFNTHIKDCITSAWNIEAHHLSPVVVNHVVSDWQLGASYGEGMDIFIEQGFYAQGKPVFSLENGKIRFDAYNTLFHLSNMQQDSIKDSVAALEKTILALATKEMAQGTDIPNFEDYFSGNILDNCSFDKAEHLCKRNLAWINAIESYLAQHSGKTIMFLFGYAHLGGPYGILALLKKLGYEINKI